MVARPMPPPPGPQELPSSAEEQVSPFRAEAGWPLAEHLRRAPRPSVGQRFRAAVTGLPHTETRILIIGRTGWGKSAMGNTILGREVFQTSNLPASKTPDLQREEGQRDGRKIVVVDTPGFFDTKRSFTQEDVLRCIHLLHPGPHVIILVIKVGKVTKEGNGTIQQVKKMFQVEGKHFLVVVFTHKDKLEEEGVLLENFIARGGAELRDIIKVAGNRYLAFNNKAGNEEKAAQVKALLSMINRPSEYYTEEMFQSDSSSCASCTML